ncbi:chemotaxis protein CheA [Cellulomonas sp. ATA003]|uniref:chemotaxis protein CheA n=1 Tax=Cellulomonas sp. ATA003 TaxID=3073064 RepID=UPI002873032D|nr:chemotaxis protein CheA [Cellulomonas sp. ATA003]WNB87581.1 chemotaxis protein CheA [Cellulomonas sp. ATA003]
MDEIVREFLVESYENLDQLDQDLVALEGAPDSRELLSSVFRTIHTIKGTSGFLAFGLLERVAHAGENLLVELRDGRRSMDQPTTDVLLLMVDTVRVILGRIEASGTEGDVPIDGVIEQIRTVLEGRAQSVDAPVEVIAPVEDVAVAPADDVVAAPVEVAAPAAPARTGLVGSRSATAAVGPAPVAAPAPAPVAASAPAAVAVVEHPGPHPAPSAHPAPGGVVPAPQPAPVSESAPGASATPPPKTAAKPAVKAAESGSETPGLRTASETSIRVDVELLDALMRQVGELVLARNQISRLADGNVDLDLVRSAQRLNLIASELQEGVMKTRMQPIDHVWSKMPRIVRDLAAVCGRQVRLDMVGGDTELDRTLLEAVKDPLTHLVRNAVDHGIESADVRTAAGKVPTGLLTLRAYHAGGQVVVEVTDDGKGIDPEKVGTKAVERGLRTAEQVALMSPQDLLQMLFLPGFSTAEAVTNVSGRGVGMDVVRTKIEAIGGAVEVESVVGRGTTWRLRIPLTLAIMPALTVESAGELYAIPQVSLLELVALDGQKAGGAIEYINSAPVYRLRGTLLPLVSLRDVLEYGGERDADTPTVIAVLQADTQRFGLVVDRVLNTEEIVVKPLSARLKAIGAYAGATLLGDGRVSLILDVQAIARRTLSGDALETDWEQTAALAARAADAEQVLVAGIGGGRRVAIPLSAVTRLERLRQEVIEHVGGREVVQYRGAIVPLVRLERLLGGYSDSTAEELLVVVYTRGTRSVAIVVEEIVDIVEDDFTQHSQIDDHGLVGSTVLKDRVTELLDVKQAVMAADPSFFDELVGSDSPDMSQLHILAGASA